MKTFIHTIRKSIFLYFSVMFLLTACESADTAAVSSADNSISQEIPDTDGYAELQSSSSENVGSAASLSELQVHFIDVGQGDSTLILCGNDSMLIDAGDNSKGTAVQLYLQKQGVEELTYLIGTHPDSDHIGGLDVIMTKFDCGTVIMPDVTSDTATYRDVIDTMDYRNYKNTLPQVGDVYSLGDAEFTIIAPNREYDDDNNSSVGIRLVHGNNVFLFTGDAGAEAEADMLQNGIDLKADVLHAGHHGSDTSGSQDFIREVSPEYAVISCGADNPYGHPHEQALAVLKEQGVQIFRTDEQGSIVAVSDGESITWNVEPSRNWNAGTGKEDVSSQNASGPQAEMSASESTASSVPQAEAPAPGDDTASVSRPETSDPGNTSAFVPQTDIPASGDTAASVSQTGIPASGDTAASVSQTDIPASGDVSASVPQSDASASEDTAASMSQPEVTAPETDAITYVLNHNTGKFHDPGCSSVDTIKESNREDTTMSREEVIAAGFVPCKRCNP